MSLENRAEYGEGSQINSIVNEFPMGTNVLVVDPSFPTLFKMKKIMTKYAFQVTIYGDAEEALTFLRKGKHEINIVIWDFHMPGIDGLQALEIIGTKMDLPVVIISDDDPTESVMQAMVRGACAYLTKPVRKETLGNIWQHIVRKRMMSKRMGPVVQSESVESNGLRRERSVNPYIDRERVNKSKKRMVWTRDLRQKFLQAIDILGGHKSATPKALVKLLRKMKIEGLTKRNVCSHLQKYRLRLKREKILQQVQEGCWPSHSGTSSLGQATYPVQENQYQNDYLELNNSNQFITNTMPRLPYDLDHFQQQQQQLEQQQHQLSNQLNYMMRLNEPQQASGINTMPPLPYDLDHDNQFQQQQYQLSNQLNNVMRLNEPHQADLELTNNLPPFPNDLDNPQQQQYQLPHQWNNVMRNNEPELASGINLTDLDAIYPSLPYDPNVNYHFNQ